VNEVLIGMTVGERLPELLQSPFRRRVGGYVVMEDSTSAQVHNHEYVQGAECGSDPNEEVTGNDHLGMITDESQPTLIHQRENKVLKHEH
jgi:hypothetical protein